MQSKQGKTVCSRVQAGTTAARGAHCRAGGRTDGFCRLYSQPDLLDFCQQQLGCVEARHGDQLTQQLCRALGRSQAAVDPPVNKAAAESLNPVIEG
jgi:hypothetical protein